METIEHILSGQGPLSEYVPEYSPRTQQLEMALAIENAIRDRQSLVCEAGTGTGKTFAYLIPAMLAGKKIIISTGTRHLQDQLFLKDLPLVHRVVDRAVNVSLLKGRANYLCLQHMNLSEVQDRYLHQESLAQLQEVKQWATHTSHGDLSELSHIPEDAPVRSLVTSTTDNCLNQECDFFDKCHLFRARRRAADADIVVVNHHLFFSDLTLKERGYGELLPAADVIIFDEAHQLPDIASLFFSQSISSRQITELIRDSKAAYYEEAADLPEFPELLDKVDKATRDLRLVFHKNEQRNSWFEVREKPGTSSAFSELMEKLHDVYSVLDEFSNRGKVLDSCYQRTGTIMNLLDSFDQSNDPDNIQWMETRGNGFLFHQTPLNTAETFRALMSDYDCVNIFTSATLSVAGDFSLFVGQMGLSDAETLTLESPFDFKRQTLLYLPSDMPDPRSDKYTETFVHECLPVLELTRGRAFLLFTSHRALRIAATLLKDVVNYPILVQGEAPRTELLDEFRSNHHSILLGTSSFWEGVDVKGQALSCVIIDKLPFASPADPVLKARMKKMEEQGKRPFIDYQIPEAVINLKQGVGRLIRDAGDYGLLAIYDPRLRSKSYGRIFLKSLPDMSHTSDLQEVEQFFSKFE